MATEYVDERVTCNRCRERLAGCPVNEHGFPLAAEVFEVGNPARPDMGHALYFTDEGRSALCAADRVPGRAADNPLP